MIRKGKKCICKKCEDCNLFYLWDMKNKEGLAARKEECLFEVIAKEIPRIRGAIDGLQGDVDEARNRSVETKDSTLRYAAASSKIMEKMSRDFITVLQNIEHKMIGR